MERIVKEAYGAERYLLVQKDSINKMVYMGENQDKIFDPKTVDMEKVKEYFENEDLQEEHGRFVDYLEDMEISFDYMKDGIYVDPAEEIERLEGMIIYSCQDDSFSEPDDYFYCFETENIFEYWDGSNWKQIVLDDDGEDYELEELESNHHDRGHYTNYLYKVTDKTDNTVEYLTVCCSQYAGSLPTVDRTELTTREEILEEYDIDIDELD